MGYAGGWRSGGYHLDAKGGGAYLRSDSRSRLQDGSSATSGEHGMPEEPWRHRAHVRGGRTEGEDAESEEFEIGNGSGPGPAQGGIRVKTTVTVTEKVDWLDDLY